MDPSAAMRADLEYVRRTIATVEKDLDEARGLAVDRPACVPLLLRLATLHKLEEIYLKHVTGVVLPSVTRVGV